MDEKVKINFNIVNQEIDLTEALNTNKEWWFKNVGIDVNKKIEDLDNNDKIGLIQLAIYEGYLDTEILCNQPKKSFTINNE